MKAQQVDSYSVSQAIAKRSRSVETPKPDTTIEDIIQSLPATFKHERRVMKEGDTHEYHYIGSELVCEVVYRKDGSSLLVDHTLDEHLPDGVEFKHLLEE